jgi:hypothetical protein
MWVSPTHTCLFIGMLTPAMRAIAISPRDENAELYTKKLRNSTL